MQFTKYSGIENSYREKFLQFIQYRGLADPAILWHATEKVHGANFALYYDGETLEAAKRSGFIRGQEIENFFHSDVIIDDIRDRIIELANEVLADNEGVVTVAVCGELFGGIYPHKDVPNNNAAKKVQKEVFYSPNLHFYGFDIRLFTEDGESTFMELNKAYALFEKYDIFYSMPKLSGTLKECLECGCEFQTTIPARLGLPEIEDNICEGLVLSPNLPMFLPSGSRVILKNKNAKHSEKASGKSGEKKELVQISMSDEGKAIYEELEACVTENRLRNVLSHIGEVTFRDFGKILGAFSQDVREEILKDKKEEYDALEKPEQKIINKWVNGKCSELIRDNLANIVDGMF
jgi:Rnl2 family RNA ligase